MVLGRLLEGHRIQFEQVFFSIMSSLGRGEISCEAPRSFSRKEGLVMVDCVRLEGFLVCSMLVSPCAVKTNSMFIAIDLIIIFFTAIKEVDYYQSLVNSKLVELCFRINFEIANRKPLRTRI